MTERSLGKGPVLVKSGIQNYTKWFWGPDLWHSYFIRAGLCKKPYQIIIPNFAEAQIWITDTIWKWVHGHWSQALHIPWHSQRASPTLLPSLPHPQGSSGTCFPIVKSKFDCSIMGIRFPEFLPCITLCSPIFSVSLGVFNMEGDSSEHLLIRPDILLAEEAIFVALRRNSKSKIITENEDNQPGITRTNGPSAILSKLKTNILRSLTSSQLS